MKYYAVPGWVHPLAIRTEPGPLTEEDFVRNLVRMQLMEEQELTVEESFQASLGESKELEEMRKNWKWQLMNDRELTDILMDSRNRKYSTDTLENQLGEQAVPILEAMKAENWEPREQTEESAAESLMDYLEPYDLAQFVEEFHPTEWD